MLGFLVWLGFFFLGFFVGGVIWVYAVLVRNGLLSFPRW